MSTVSGPSFISYISEAERDIEINKKLAEAMSIIHQSPDEQLKGRLLHGEVAIGYANKVIRYNVHDDPTRGISGNLVCTNFRLIFLTAEKASYDLIELKNRMLDEHDILLNNIESIFVEYPNKRKKLIPSSKIKDGIQRLELHCKDFRVAAFNFKLTVKGEEKEVIKPILHHSYPQAVTRLFAFDYKHETDINQACSIPLYRNQNDWDDELHRCGAPKKSWRVTAMNKKFTELPTMPAYFVAPGSVSDSDLATASKHFNENRLPMWCWSDSSGCSLVRMATLRTDSEHQRYEQELQLAIQKADPKNRPLKCFNLSKLCPSCLQLQQSFNKLKTLCMPASETDFWDTDREWYSSLHSTKWMQHVSSVLSVAKDAASALRKEKQNIIIQENNGMDITPVITCLIQLMLDPTSRTLDGFQALIQREWVVAGHPFLDRLGHMLQPKRKRSQLKTSITEDGDTMQLGPIFLLFLDCVYQMMVQFPARFEPSVTFLTVLYDGTRMTAFDTFIFNNERQRHKKLCENELHDQPYAKQEVDREPTSQFLPIWAWKMQFTKLDMSLFNNPLYRMRTMKDYTKYVEKSALMTIKKRKLNTANSELHSSELDDRNGDLPDGVTCFSKDPGNYHFSTPDKSPSKTGKKKSSFKEAKAEEYKKKIERDSPHPLNKTKTKSASLERSEEKLKKEPYKATPGGHFPKVALVPKNYPVSKQTSMVDPPKNKSQNNEHRFSRSKSCSEGTSEDEDTKTEDADAFMPLSDFVNQKSTENESKLKPRFSIRRRRTKETVDVENFMQNEPKTYSIQMQHPTIHPDREPRGTLLALYPEASVSKLKFWRQCYFRWLQWSQIYGGGPASTLQQESLLYDDVHILHNKLQMLKKQLKEDDLFSYHTTFLDRDLHSSSGMYFGHSHENWQDNEPVFDDGLQKSSSQTSLNLLSSYFPYSPVRCLRSKSIVGTPISDFLQGGSFFNFGKNRGKHSRSPSGISITRSLAQSVEDLSSVTITSTSPTTLSSKSVEDLTVDVNLSTDTRNRTQSDLPPGRERLKHADGNLQKAKMAPPGSTSSSQEHISYETSL